MRKPMPDRLETTDRETARRYRQRAVELRQQAQVAVTPRLRELLLENADLYAFPHVNCRPKSGEFYRTALSLSNKIPLSGLQTSLPTVPRV